METTENFYQIVVAEHRDELAQEIQKAMTDGCLLAGGVAVTIDTKTNKFRYHQAVYYSGKPRKR